MKITAILIFNVALLHSICLGQIKQRITFNFNDTTFVRVLDGVVLNNSYKVEGGINSIFRISEEQILRKIGLPPEGKPYMILNSKLEGYQKVTSLLPENLRKFQIPIIKDGKLHPWTEFKDMEINRFKYSDKKNIDNREVPFGFLEVLQAK